MLPDGRVRMRPGTAPTTRFVVLPERPRARQTGLMEETRPAEARTVIERTVWRYGVTGDMCALLTEQILAALSEAGFVIETIKQ